MVRLVFWRGFGSGGIVARLVLAAGLIFPRSLFRGRFRFGWAVRRLLDGFTLGWRRRLVFRWRSWGRLWCRFFFVLL
jgi:hypothetical protein